VTEPIWLLRSVVEAVHDAELAEHGGAAGLRDAGLLESALARPLNLHHFGETDPFVLAAAYAFGIARNHPFVDGNKRTGLLAAYVFLRINGRHLIADEASAASNMLALAAGEMTEADFADWLRENAQKAKFE
jgi:death-on-curing protein